MSKTRAPQGIKGIIFDKDGTLFDFTATWAAWAANVITSETGDDVERAAKLAEALGFDSAAKVFHPSSIVIASPARDIVETAMPFLEDTSVEKVLSRWNDLAATAPQVEAAPLIPFTNRLKTAGMRLGVATNDAEAPARAHLLAAGVEGAFDFIAGSDSGFGGKPETGQLMAFCAQTGVSAQACVMVGDSTHDLHAGRAAGMTCVAVLTGVAGVDELASFADVVLPSIAEIPAWLGI